jgi:Ca2+-binding RTX toxin-like protein
MAALVAIALPAFIQSAAANHGSRTLEVTPEVQSIPFGTTTTTLTAVLSDPAETTVNIDWENEGDGEVTFQARDATCDIPAGQQSCTITVSGTGSDYWRVWIDHDKVNSTAEVDEDEERISNPDTDCNQAQDQAGNCVSAPPPFGDATGPGDASLACSVIDDLLVYAPTDEPDCTDVVRVSWVGAPGVVTTMDCDDLGGTDTERETVSEGDSVDYECSVFDQNGDLMAVDVYGEVESGANDPDEGTSYGEPDYLCPATYLDPPTQIFPSECSVTVEPVRNQTGTAEICWWVVAEGEDIGTVGASRCAGETTGENQTNNAGDDTPHNDLADQTEATWQDPSTFVLDCQPETDTNPAGTSHTLVCSARSPSTDQPVAGVAIDVEASGANNPDSDALLQTPDFTCTTEATGSCSITHGPGGSGSTTGTGGTTYRAWIDADGSNLVAEADTTEGQNEQTTPGATAEPDNTDVITKEWTEQAGELTVSPTSDTASIGECNPFTYTLINDQDDPVQGATLDLEQVHERAQNSTADDEPAVDFCVPASGPNPSDVDTADGDLGPGSSQITDREDPDNPGTAGGETVGTTDSQGRITIGVTVAPDNNSDGSGVVEVTGFLDEDNNDDPDDGEPQVNAVKTWSPPSEGARTIDCEPETQSQEAGGEATVTCTVRDADGNLIQGQSVTFSEDGEGDFTTPTTTTTNDSGEVSASVSATAAGTQTVTGTITESTGADTAECERPADDPEGSPAGVCSDSVTVTWTPSTQDRCPGYEDVEGNHIVGTDGDDTLTGTEGDDIICGLGGDDAIDGNGGNDIILGGSGNDDISGGGGADVIKGQGGNDTVRGGAGNDKIRGSGGKDTLIGGGGKDDIRGGAGADKVSGNGGNDRLYGNGGPDRINGGAGKDFCKGGGGKDKIRKCEKGQTKNG